MVPWRRRGDFFILKTPPHERGDVFSFCLDTTVQEKGGKRTYLITLLSNKKEMLNLVDKIRGMG